MGLLLGAALAQAQTLRVSGTVTGAEDGMPIPGVSVIVKGTTIGTATDMDGKYTLNVPSDAQTLVFSYIGYATQEVALAGRTNGASIDVVMSSTAEEVEEVVIVGYGSMRKKDVTSSIAKVGGDDISKLATASFDQQLAGRAAGVQVITPSGVLGSTPTYRVRGISSVTGGTQPLIVVDGMPITSGDISEGYAKFNAMSDINPNDIESIEILKDGAATAIYGSRAANGVVLITTKKGKKGHSKVTYDGMLTWAQPNKRYDLLNADEFVEIMGELFGNYGSANPAKNTGVNTNWLDAIYQTGFQQQHSINASGGTDKSQYFFSLGYSNQDGIIRANDMRRYTIKGNLTQDATDYLKLGFDVQASNNKINGLMDKSNSLSGVGYGAIHMIPNVPIYDENDPTGYNVDNANRKALGRGGNAALIDNQIPNVMWVLDNNVNRTENTRALGNVFAEFTLMKGLTLRTQGGLNISKVKSFTFWDPNSGDGYSYGGLLDESSGTHRDWNWQNILNYNASFGEHNILATAVAEYSKYDYDYNETTVQELSDEFFKQHTINSTYGKQFVYGSMTGSGMASYMFRANYNYASKYYIGASIRRDGLSKLSKEHRWGTFWGASVAYRISNEGFYESLGIKEILSDLRVRASYATLGNSSIGGNFPYLGMYSPGRYGTQNTIGWSQMGNDKLKWETTETFDIGLDGNLLDGRINFEFAYWQKNSKDLVMKVPTPPSLGIPYNEYSDNIGKIKNSGIELQLGAYIIDNQDFKWHADFNFSTLKNVVKELYGGEDIVNAYTIIREGESYRSIYGYDYYGVNPENGNPIWKKADGSLVQFDTFGDYDYKVYDPANPADVSKPSSLNSQKDKKVLGTTIPTWFGGFTNTFTYKGFDLNIFLRFSGGNKIMNVTTQDQLLNLGFANQGREILGRWKSKDEPGDGKTPKIRYKGGNKLFNSGQADSHFVEKGDFLKLATVTLGYNLPKSLLAPLKLSGARIYVQGQNLLTLTGYSGLDPETFATDTDYEYTAQPQQRSFTVGLNITF